MAIMERVKDKPGQFYIPSLNKFVNIIEWSVSDRFDTQVTASGAITAGTTETWFRDLTNKDPLDGNFPSTKRVLGSGEEMVLERIGVYLPSAIGNTVVNISDIKKTADNLYVEFKINRDVVKSGSVIQFPSGYGLAGQTTQNETGIVSVGVPSTAAAAKLAREQELNMNTEVDGLGTWYDHVWDAANMPTTQAKVWHRLILHGLIKAAGTRNT